MELQGRKPAPFACQRDLEETGTVIAFITAGTLTSALATPNSLTLYAVRGAVYQ